MCIHSASLFIIFFRDILKGRSDALEQELRQAKEQVVEMDHTVTDYSQLIQKKDDRVAELLQDLEQLAVEHQQASKEILELQSDIDTLAAELEAEKADRAQGDASRARSQAELDELRALLEAKSSEETRRNEVEKSKELELANLRSQVAKMHQDLMDTRHSALETQGKLKVDLEQSARELAALQASHESLVQQARAAQSHVAETQAAISELEKGKRSMESELQSLRSRAFDSETTLAEAQKAKEVGKLLVYMCSLIHSRFHCRAWNGSCLRRRTNIIASKMSCSSSRETKLLANVSSRTPRNSSRPKRLDVLS